MLFALDWMQRTWDKIVSAISLFAQGLTIPGIAQWMTSTWLILIACLIGGIVLCTYGFRRHKLISGIAAAALFAYWGWLFGGVMNPEQTTTWILYAVLFAIAGFVLGYMFYYLNVFAGSWFLFIAIFELFGLSVGYRFWFGLLGAVVFTMLYVRYTPVMTAISGAIVLGIMSVKIHVLASLVTVILIAGGIILQLFLERRHNLLLDREMQEQIEKYPYGPGLAYGWEEPPLRKK